MGVEETAQSLCARKCYVLPALIAIPTRFLCMNERGSIHTEMAEHDRPVRLERMEADPLSALIARLMDTVFVIPGTNIRFGLDAIVGLFPGIGDSVGALISSVLISQGARMGVPKIVLLRMAGNILINTVVGAIPLFGDVFSVFFRSNVKNCELLRRYAGHHRRANASDWIWVTALIAVIVCILGLVFVGAFIVARSVFRGIGSAS